MAAVICSRVIHVKCEFIAVFACGVNEPLLRLVAKVVFRAVDTGKTSSENSMDKAEIVLLTDN